MSLMDLFRPNWKHSNLTIRKNAAFQQTDPQIIAEIINNETDIHLRDDVLTRIKSLKLVAQIEKLLTVEESKVKAQHHIHNLQIDLCKSGKAGQEELAYVKTLTCEKDLENIVRNGKNLEHRLAAVERCQDEKFLFNYASAKIDKDIALSALERLAKNEESVATLAKKAHTKAVRQRAQKWVDKKKTAEKEAAIAYAKANPEPAAPVAPTVSPLARKIVQELKNITSLAKWPDLKEELTKEEAKWQKLDEFSRSEVQAEFDAALEACQKSYNAWEEREGEAERLNKQIEEEFTFREKLTESVEACEDAEELKALQAKWLDETVLEDQAFNNLNRFYRKAITKAEKAIAELAQNLARKEETLAKVAAVLEECKSADNKEKLVGKASAILKRTSAFKEEEAVVALQSFVNEQQEAQKKAIAKQEAQAVCLIEELEKLSSQAPAKETTDRIKAIRQEWKALPATFQDKSNASKLKLEELCEIYFSKLKEKIEEREWESFASVSAKESLIKKVLLLSKEEDVKVLAKKLKDIQAEWKNSGHVSGDKSEEIWGRFKTACDLLYDRCHAAYKEVLVQKEALVIKAEEYAKEEGQEITEKLKDLQKQWKELSHTPLKEETVLWERLRTACDGFFAKRKEAFEVLKEQQQKALVIKEEIVAKAQAIVAESGKETAQLLKDLQKQWKEAGAAPRSKDQKLWADFRGVCDAFFSQRKAGFEERQKERESFKVELEEHLEALKKAVADFKSPGDWTGLGAELNDLFHSTKNSRRLDNASQKQFLDDVDTLRKNFFDQRHAFYKSMDKDSSRDYNFKEEALLKLEVLKGDQNLMANEKLISQAQAQFEKVSVNAEVDAVMQARFDAAFAERTGEAVPVTDDTYHKREHLCRRLAGITGMTLFDPENEKALTSVVVDLQAALTAGPSAEEDTGVRMNRGDAHRQVREILSLWRALPSSSSEARFVAQSKRFLEALVKFYNN